MIPSSESSSPSTRLKSERVQGENPSRSTRLKSERVQDEARAGAGWELDEQERSLRFAHDFAESFQALAFAGCSLALASAHGAGVQRLMLHGRHLELVLASPEEAGLTDREHRAAYLLEQLYQRFRPAEETPTR